jgi:hypothetical protein
VHSAKVDKTQIRPNQLDETERRSLDNSVSFGANSVGVVFSRGWRFSLLLFAEGFESRPDIQGEYCALRSGSVYFFWN